MLAVTEVRINYEHNPVGVAGLFQVGWIMESDERDVVQSAAQVQIALTPDFAQDALLYDSGITQTRESAHFVPEGFAPQSARKYYVRVRAWAGEQESAWSDPAFLVTALQDTRREWRGAFVSAETEADAGNSKGTYVRGGFSVDGRVKEAFAFATAFGIYEFYLNGRKVGEDILTPGWTSYHKHLMYQTYEVTDYLREGTNRAGASLGAGWYKGLMGFKHNRNNYGTQTAFALHLLIRYEDGREQLVTTGADWEGCDSPVTFAEIYDGEHYDAAGEVPGWSEPDAGTAAGIVGAAKWHPVTILSSDLSALTAQTNCRVREHETFPVRSLFTTPKGERVLDFGQNMSAWLHIKAAGKKGDVIRIRCFETLDKDGNVYLDNLREAKQELVYTFGRDGEIEYHPTFTFMGFQYAQILSFPGEAKPENFTARAVYSAMEQTGTLSTSNPDLNQLMHNILWGLKSNFVDVPTDCPQRDERMGWTGDAQIFCRTATFLTNTYQFYSKWLADVAADQTPEGGVAHVVPDIISGSVGEDWLLSQGTHSAAAWADVAVINPWTMYLCYGDTEILRRQFDSMKAWIDFMRAHAKDYIWNYQLQFGDWVALDAEEGSYFGATPNDLTCTAYFAYSTGVFVKILHVLGQSDPAKEEMAAEYEALYEKIVDKFRTTFFDAEGNLTAQTQTAHIVALYFGLTPPQYVAQTVENLKKLLAKENGHLVTGFVGTPYFCHALSQNGALEEAYDLLLKDDFPSWLYQVRQGATTVWEHWDGKKPDGSMWSPDMNSFNHYAYGAIGEWLTRVMGGLEAKEQAPGYREFIVEPRFGGGLREVSLSYDSVYGQIQIGWRLEPQEKESGAESAAHGMLRVRIPVNTKAQIRLHTQAGPEAQGLEFGKAQTGEFWQAQAGSGEYEIRF
ncbi:MAG: family 78 glycoside hydrolase catalytic domain [Eubacteriales bacterium]|nr:family 78 glycoside hydrolase catalytic domain [Eubacteriales bacterium]